MLRREVERDHRRCGTERIGSRAARSRQRHRRGDLLLHAMRNASPRDAHPAPHSVTINDTLPGSRAAPRWRRSKPSAHAWRKTRKRFAEQALKHSGMSDRDERRPARHTAPRPALRRTRTGGLRPPSANSDVVESPIGFHVLRCDAIVPQRLAAPTTCVPASTTIWPGQRKKICQKSWINGLRRKPRRADTMAREAGTCRVPLRRRADPIKSQRTAGP